MHPNCCGVHWHLRIDIIGAGAAAVIGEGAGLSGNRAIAFAHGLTVMAFAFAYGPVSGGHFNPTVTIGVLAAGACVPAEAAGYIVSQLLGGVAGALFLVGLLGARRHWPRTPHSHTTSLSAHIPHDHARCRFMIEAVLGFFLVTVVLSTRSRAAPAASHRWRSEYVTLNIPDGFTGAPFNPARALGRDGSKSAAISAMPGCTDSPMIVGAIVAALLHTGLARLTQRDWRRPGRTGLPRRAE